MTNEERRNLAIATYNEIANDREATEIAYEYIEEFLGYKDNLIALIGMDNSIGAPILEYLIAMFVRGYRQAQAHEVKIGDVWDNAKE